MLSLAASIITLALGIVVYSFNRKSILNKLFFLTSTAAFLYSFTTVMMWTANSFEVANFWHKMGTMWPLFIALVMNFAVVYTESGWLKNKWNYLILYLPAVSFWLIDLSTNMINSAPILREWGYNDPAAGTWLYIISTIWAAALPVLAFAICFRLYIKTDDFAQKKRRQYVSVGFAIPIAAYIITNMIGRALEMDIPNLGIVATLFFSVFVGYAIVKHELFTFDAALAAENILSTMPDSLILADLNGKILKVNERFINFSGYPEKQLIGKAISNFCSQKQKKACQDIVYELRENKLVRNLELEFQTKNYEKRTILFSGSVVTSKIGHAIGLTCVLHDITELKKMEERLVKAERLASIGELAGQIGHDLRNPLAGIKNGIYLIKKKGKQISEKEQHEILQVIGAAIEDSNRIITSLVDYSSELHLEKVECTPKTIMQQALTKIQIPANITLLQNVYDEPKIYADQTQISNIVAHLIQNAIQAIPEKGSIQVLSNLNSPDFELSILDSGTGIPPHNQPKLFSPLFTTKAKGMGMGLAISKRVIEAHGGKITVESKQGRGTMFTISLPANNSTADKLHFQPIYKNPQFNSSAF